MHMVHQCIIFQPCICGLHWLGERILELRLNDHRMESYTALADAQIMRNSFIGLLYSLAG